MPKRSAPSTKPKIALPPPRVIGALPEVPGGEDNLLRKDAWLLPLRIEFEWWDDPAPLPELYDVIQLIWDGDEEHPVAEKRYPGNVPPVSPPDLWLEVPVTRLDEGVHTLSYRLLPWNNSGAQSSLTLNVTIDKTAPVLGTGSQLIFPPDVLPPNQLTAYYLDMHEDEVGATFPAYTSPRPWDRITWYWGASPGNQDEGVEIVLDDTNFADPVKLKVPGQFIRDRGDGLRYVWYQVHDRAGNPSLRSDPPVVLDVAATPIPRSLPWPTIENAAGSGELQTLDPLQARTGAVVEVPEKAVIYPREPVQVIWGKTDELGYWVAEQPITPGQKRYAIPMQSVAAYIGKTPEVTYKVTDGLGNEWPSVKRKVQVLKLSNLPTVQCHGLSGGSLSLKTVPAAGAILRLDTWPLMTTDQWLLITMTGVGSSGQDSPINVINKRALTDQEVIGGVGGAQGNIRVPYAFLNSLRRNAPLTGKVYVSFDGGITWPPIPAPNFPMLHLTLID